MPVFKSKFKGSEIDNKLDEIDTIKADYENLGNLNKNKLKGVNIEPSTNLNNQKAYVDRFYDVNKGDSIAVIFEFTLNTTTNAVTENTTNNPVTKQLIQYIRSKNSLPIAVRLNVGTPHTTVPGTASFGSFLFGDRYDSDNNCYDASLSASLSTSCWLYWCQLYAKYCIDNNIDTVFITNEWVYATDKTANKDLIEDLITVLKSYCTSYNPNFTIKFGMSITSSVELQLIEASSNVATVLSYIDIIGINVYPHVHYYGTDYEYTDADLRRNIYQYMQDVERLAIKYKKPIYITEIGACANNLGLIDTSTSATAVDVTTVQRDDLQALYFQLVFEIIYMNKYVNGFYLFIAGIMTNLSNKKGYQFQGRVESEAVVAKYYGGDVLE